MRQELKLLVAYLLQSLNLQVEAIGIVTVSASTSRQQRGMCAGTTVLMYQEVTMVVVMVVVVMEAEEAGAEAEAAGDEEVVDEGVTAHHAIRMERIRMERRQMERKLRLMVAVACR